MVENMLSLVELKMKKRVGIELSRHSDLILYWKYFSNQYSIIASAGITSETSPNYQFFIFVGIWKIKENFIIEEKKHELIII